MRAEDIGQVVVIGTGQMGPGIACCVACGGLQVRMIGRSPESVARGLAAVQAQVEQLVGGKILSSSQGDDLIRRVGGTMDLENAVRGADLVIESIVEDLAVKQGMFAFLDRACPSSTILASNTSYLPATRIAAEMRRPERMLVTHFWNPPHLMPLVEVIKGEHTDEDVVGVTLDLMRACGKRPVRVQQDRPGQLGNRLLYALIREAVWIVQEGIASVEDVDTALKSGPGLRLPVWGILERVDMSGLDRIQRGMDFLTADLSNHRQSLPLINEKVERGELGIKAGRGFYEWSKPRLAELLRTRDEFLLERLRAQKTTGE